MSTAFNRTSQDHTRAVHELRAELAEFSYDGLVLLRHHLAEGRVLRGSWAGCVISYKRGAAGSARRDRHGHARNAFTTLWDSGWMTDEDVLSLVEAELRRRTARASRPSKPPSSPSSPGGPGSPSRPRPPIPATTVDFVAYSPDRS
jgi:hypothetical protein